MSYDAAGDCPLDYFPCRYGRSQQVFRGPRRDLGAPFACFLGGTETYGKFVREPFPALVEAATGLTALNLGCLQAGPDAYLNDPGTLDLARQAAITVVQITGALNLSNRLYTVHPRRNDRFLRASPMLQALFRDVDFMEFSFTRHLFQALSAGSERQLRAVVDELQTAWVARMELLLGRLAGPVLLLWMGSRAPQAEDAPPDLAQDPPLIHQGMIACLRPRVSRYVQVVASAKATAMAGAGDSGGKSFAPLQEPAALALPGPALHAEVAAALVPVFAQLR